MVRFSTHILTSHRIPYLPKSVPEHRIREHSRSIHKIAYSTIVPYYCMTGSADGDIRVYVSFSLH